MEGFQKHRKMVQESVRLHVLENPPIPLSKQDQIYISAVGLAPLPVIPSLGNDKKP